MAGSTTSPLPEVAMTPAAFLAKWRLRYKDNDDFQIKESDLRDQAEDMTKTFVAKAQLTVNSIRGNALLLPTLSDLLTVEANVLAVGQPASVANATDAGSAAAGVEAGAASFRLIKDSAGPLWAYVNPLPLTTQRVRASWVRTDGSEADKVATYPAFLEEDHPYQPGDVFQYTYPDGATLLHQVNDPAPTTYQNPLPTGQTDAHYTVFAPLPAPPSNGYVAGTALQEVRQSGEFATLAAQARLIRPGVPAQQFSTIDQANLQADYGDTVEALGTSVVSTLLLKGGVTYATGGRMVNWSLLTDNGNTVITCKVTGNSPEGRYGGGWVSVTGAGSDIVVEKALYPEYGYAVYQSNGRLTHSGLLRGGSPDNTVAVLNGSANFRHVAGAVRLGGSLGFQLSGSAQALIKSDGPIDQGYKRVVECAGSAKIRLEGGSLFTGAAGFALSEIVYMSGGEVTLANGTYDNTAGNATAAYLTGGTLIVDNATVVRAIGGTAGTVILRNGSKCLGPISSALVVVNEQPAGGGSGVTELQIRSDSTTRVFSLDLTDKVKLLTVSALGARNAQGAAFQVNKYAAGAWQGGLERSALVDVQADLDALTPADRTAGAELLIKTIPVTSANTARLLVQLQHG
ncbi:hypothetical protein [Hymenobacter rigui]|uniref:Uncharacterized protein n=1 Tax=Hymenobacter rigui TaxID=334424 RepID=A0A3R9V2D1_9BACT|nr:hypothetical protein [Hymenobacter rigui]RSK45192.1 hypothetical protein EI291_18955 [Hymenobacter rigui]